MSYLTFKLSDDFIQEYTDKKVKWGFEDAGANSLGEITFLRTYSRKKEDGTKERWFEVCRRVIEGMYSIQKDWASSLRLPWNDHKAQRSAQEAYDRLFELKWTPPGRGLWVMGTPLTNRDKNSAALQNCAFVSTGSMTKYDPAAPFCFLMEASMLGVGVGFDTKGADKNFEIYAPSVAEVPFVIPDSREGWVQSIQILINSYLMPKKYLPEFDYSEIRPAGEPIKTFGGSASGPEPLKKLHESISKLFVGRAGESITTTDIVDVGNLIGVCVVAGNVRRSAELVLGSVEDEDFLNLKNWQEKPERAEWSWMSNNSVSVEVGQDLTPVFDGIALNGEPGVIWMDVSRQFGRLIDPANNKDWRAEGYNPCAEQTLESYEMCVSGTTLIHTKEGIFPIADLVGSPVEIWNGVNWSTVTPFFTGNSEVYRVKFSDGSYLDATAGHEWSVRLKTARSFSKIRTDELEIGSYLPEFSLENPDGKPFEYAYQWGWFMGDGYTDRSSVRGIVQEFERERAIVALGLEEIGAPCTDALTGNIWYRPNFKQFIPLNIAENMRREDKLPNEVFTWSVQAISEFIGGWIDTDGSVIKNPNTEHYVLYGCENKLRQAQILLRRIGVNHSTLRLFAKKGEETNYGVRSKDLYRLLIPSYEASNIATRLKVATKFGSRFKKNNAHEGSIIDAARKQKIVSISKISGVAPTFCFNEPEHHMGVFGNVLTYQCTLVETYLNRHESLEDFQRTLKFAYLYAKTVTLLPTHWKQTNAIMQRNRRIGTSMSGIANFMDNNSAQELRHWMDEGYQTIQTYDKTYSEWLGVRESIKTTTVKPSGTVSILAGESPGVHWSPGGEYFNRAVRFSKKDPMVVLFQNSGYVVEDAVSDPDGTVVVYFPVHSTAKRSEKQVTIFEKAALAVEAQRWWSDNSVSVTLSFDAETEAKHVSTVLHMHEGQLKTVSFLPMGNEVYDQQPYTEITQEDYEEAQMRILPLLLDDIYNGLGLDAIGEKYCTTDACIVEEFKNEVTNV